MNISQDFIETKKEKIKKTSTQQIKNRLTIKDIKKTSTPVLSPFCNIKQNNILTPNPTKNKIQSID